MYGLGGFVLQTNVMKIRVLKEQDDSSYLEKELGGLGVTREVECYCGNNDFKVIQGYYFTAVECRECHRKYIVHEG